MMDPEGVRDTFTYSPDLETIKKKELFTCAMKGKWRQVTKMYKEDPRANTARITRSGDTALHIAVTEGNREVVSEMVSSVFMSDLLHSKHALQTHNNKSNTALHLAAAMGDATICEIIATVEPSLVDCCNGDGETPLFLAALFGKYGAFLRLHYIRHRIPAGGHIPPCYANCRRNDGNTILHCAISEDYYDLAFQIIHLYEDLVTSVNEDGLSPLHLLAAKPSAFRSGSRLGRLESIIYHCLYVDKLKESPEQRQLGAAVKEEQAIHQYFPPNYHVFGDIFTFIKSAFTTAVGEENESDQANTKDLEKAKNHHTDSSGGSKARDHGSGLFPPNYRTCFNLVKFFYLALLVILGQGSSRLNKIRRKKEKHTWSVQIMKALLDRACAYQYEDDGSKPDFPIPEEMSSIGLLSRAEDGGVEDCFRKREEKAILIAAKNGVTEMVEEIIEFFPVAIQDINEDKKNVVLLAVEHRQPHVYKLLLGLNILKESAFRQVDRDGNGALHLAAQFGGYEPWLIPDAALQIMQWEIKWFEFVKESMPSHLYAQRNKRNETPYEIFIETHAQLVKSGGEWLNKTSESCSVVAALVAGVSFATSSTIPGGNDDKTGKPTLKGHAGFDIFAVSALIALCFSVTALILFLSMLTSRKRFADFMTKLPLKLFIALSSLFVSIISMFVSFCAAHSFVLEDKFKKSVVPLYAIICLPVYFGIAEFPLYMDLSRGIFMKVERSYDRIRV